MVYESRLSKSWEQATKQCSSMALSQFLPLPPGVTQAVGMEAITTLYITMHRKTNMYGICINSCQSSLIPVHTEPHVTTDGPNLSRIQVPSCLHTPSSVILSPPHPHSSLCAQLLHTTLWDTWHPHQHTQKAIPSQDPSGTTSHIQTMAMSFISPGQLFET